VDAWDVDRGLPHSLVTNIVQTSDGYLWVGATVGKLRSYRDGKFTSCWPPPDRPPADTPARNFDIIPSGKRS